MIALQIGMGCFMVVTAIIFTWLSFDVRKRCRQWRATLADLRERGVLVEATLLRQDHPFPGATYTLIYRYEYMDASYEGTQIVSKKDAQQVKDGETLLLWCVEDDPKRALLAEFKNIDQPCQFIWITHQAAILSSIATIGMIYQTIKYFIH